MQEGIKIKISGKRPFLNFGCGPNFNPEWLNIDTVISDVNIINHNVLNGLPFENGYLEVIYCSHVIEHFSLDDAKKVISECYRTLKSNGILRIVVPDLGNILGEYHRLHELISTNPSDELFLKYKWILIELFDQASRNHQGGQMKTFINNEGGQIKDYITDRLGYIGDDLFVNKNLKSSPDKRSIASSLKMIARRVYNKRLTRLEREYIKVGKFRNSGEVHYWMYDKTFIQHLLLALEFRSVEFKGPRESNIPDWDKYNLDIFNNKVLHNSSVYVEAIK